MATTLGVGNFISIFKCDIGRWSHSIERFVIVTATLGIGKSISTFEHDIK